MLISRDPQIAEDVLRSPVCINRSVHVTGAMGRVLGLGLLTLRGNTFMDIIFIMECYL